MTFQFSELRTSYTYLPFPLHHSQRGTSRGLGDDEQYSETCGTSGWDAQVGQETPLGADMEVITAVLSFRTPVYSVYSELASA